MSPNTRRGIFLMRRIFLPGLGVMLVLGILGGLLRVGWANAIGPWLMLAEGATVLLALLFFILAGTRNIAGRHRKAISQIRS